MRPFLLALSFLTRIPVRTGEVSPREAGASLSWFPAIGALIGAALVLVAFAGDSLLSGSALLTSFVCVVFWALITGGLHLDGVADLGDALGGGRGDRARMLAIMRDPHVGAHGATALVLLLAGKLFALVELFEVPSYWPMLAIAPIVARFTCVLAMKLFAYARNEGLGRDFHAQVRWQGVAIASAWPLLGLLAIILWMPNEPNLLGDLAQACLTGMGIALLVAWRMNRLLSGITGDVHGAIIELCELCTLLAGAALARS